MIILKKIFCSIIVVLIFFSCSQTAKKPVVIPQITIDIDKAAPLVFSDFFESVSYVALSDSFLIGDIEKAKIYGNKLLVLTNKSVLIYDTDTGELILRIRNIGRGPGDYISLYDMLIDTTSNCVELLDMNGQKVLRYNMSGGFIGDFKTSFFSYSFYKNNNSDYWFYNDKIVSDRTDHNLIRYNAEENKIIAQYFPIDKHLAEYFYVTSANYFNPHPFSFYFCPSDTVYGFSDDLNSPFPRYTINFASHQTPAGFYKEKYSDIADFSNKAVRRSYIYHVTNFVENDKVSIFSFRNDMKHYWALHDKKNQMTHQGDAWKDDFNFDEKVMIEYENNPVAIDENNMYFFFHPAQLISLMKNSDFLDSSPMADSLMSIYRSANFSEQSNPILVTCKFKAQ